jgi:hypothetical protein
MTIIDFFGALIRKGICMIWTTLWIFSFIIPWLGEKFEAILKVVICDPMKYTNADDPALAHVVFGAICIFYGILYIVGFDRTKYN